MAVDQSGKISRILIGGADYSAGLISADLSDNHVDAGLIKTTGTVTLKSQAGLPGSLDDRGQNRATWKQGQTVVLEVANSSGSLTRHPRAAQRIISTEFDKKSQTLTSQVGCLLTLADYRLPTDPEDVNIDPTSPTALKTIIERLLELAGITVYTVPSIPYNWVGRFDFKSSSEDGISGGSFVEAIDKLLYAAGYIGWIDKNERFQCKAVNLKTPSTAFTVEAGGLLWYDRLSNPGPRETVRVVGTAPLVQPPKFRDEINYYNGDGGSVDPALSGTTITLLRETIQESLIGNTVNSFFEIAVPQAQALPGDAVVGALTSLVITERRVSIKTYESGPEKRLIVELVQIFKLAGAELREFYTAKKSAGEVVFGERDLFLAQERLVRYGYDAKGNLIQILEEIRQANGITLSGIGEDWSAYNLASVRDVRSLTYQNLQQWNKPRNDEWEEVNNRYQSYCLAKPSEIRQAEVEINGVTLPAHTLAQKLGLTLLTPERENSNAGQTTPPQPERLPGPTFTDVRVEGKATFQQWGGTSIQRERTIQTDFLFGSYQSNPNAPASFGKTSTPVRQANAIAEKEGGLAYGRYKGSEIGLPLSDSLLSLWEPLVAVDIWEESEVLFVLTASALSGATTITVSSIIGGVTARVNDRFKIANYPQEYQITGISGGNWTINPGLAAAYPAGHGIIMRTLRAFLLEGSQWAIEQDRANSNHDGIWIGDRRPTGVSTYELETSYQEVYELDVSSGSGVAVEVSLPTEYTLEIGAGSGLDGEFTAGALGLSASASAAGSVQATATESTTLEMVASASGSASALVTFAATNADLVISASASGTVSGSAASTSDSSASASASGSASPVMASVHSNVISAGASGTITAFATVANSEFLAFMTAVSDNSGTVGTTAQNALDAFITNSKTDNYWSKIKLLWIPLGDYAASAVCQIHPNSNKLATRVNFVSGDYSEANGYTGNGTTKYLNFNTSPTGLGLSASSCSLFLYSHSSGALGQSDIGAYNSDGSQALVLQVRVASGSGIYYYDSPNVTPGRLTFASTDGSGFHVASRTTASLSTAYRNGSTYGTTNTANTTGGTLPSSNIVGFGYSLAASLVASSPRRMSMMGAADGLSGTDVSNFWTRLQTLYSAIGRSL